MREFYKSDKVTQSNKAGPGLVLGWRYTSNWGEHKVGVIDLKRMRVVKKLPVENKPQRHCQDGEPERRAPMGHA